MFLKSYGKAKACPKCGSHDIRRGDTSSVTDELVAVRCECAECGTLFREFFTYDHSEYYGDKANV